MTTARDIIDRAMRRIGVLAEDEVLTAAAVVQALDALNDMMHGWAARGIDYLHTELALTDEFPIDARWREATVNLLAVKLAPDFGRPAPDADDSLRALQAGFMSIEESALPRTLLRTSSQRRWVDFE